MIEGILYMNLICRIAVGLYVLTGLLYLSNFISDASYVKRACQLTFSSATAVILILIAMRWSDRGYFPAVHFFDSILLIVTALALISMVIWRNGVDFTMYMATIFPITGLLVLGIIQKDTGYITAFPELESWLFIPHVLSYFVAYALLLVAGLYSLRWLIQKPHSASDKRSTDKWHDQLVSSGFLLSFAGMISGMIWSQMTRNIYWTWDSKEIWSLITLCIIAIFIMLNKSERISNSKLHILFLAGVLSMIIGYIGIYYWAPEDMHVASFLRAK